MAKPTLYLSIEALVADHVHNRVDYDQAFVFLPTFIIPSPDAVSSQGFRDATLAASIASGVPQLIKRPNFTFAMFFDMFWFCTQIARTVMIRLRGLSEEGRYAYGTSNAGLRIFLAQNDLRLPAWLPLEETLDQEWVADLADASQDSQEYDIRY